VSDNQRTVREPRDNHSQNTPTITPDEELEQYGVWVKAGPEDYVEPQGDDEGFALSDLEDSSNLELLDDAITEEEEELLSSLEEPSSDESNEELDMIDFESEDFDTPSSTFDNATSNDAFDEQLPDIPDEDLPELDDEIPLSLENEAMLSLDEPESGVHLPVELPPSDFSLEEFSDDEAQVDAFDLSFEDEVLQPVENDEVTLTDDADSLKTEEFVDSLPDLDLADDDLLDDSLSTDLGIFDDVSAVEEEMIASGNTTSQRGNARQVSPSEDSLAILRNIEEELQSIKTELKQLKTELTSLRGKTPSNESAGEEALSDSKEPTGFFEEEEDETIALTGDELDNILNTAEFTEQTGQPTEIEDFMEEFPTSAEAPAEDVVTEDLFDETSLEDTQYEDVEAPAEELPIEEITLDEDLEEIDFEEELGEFEEELPLHSPEASEPVAQKPELEPEPGESPLLPGDESEVDALAEMDIESELAEIEELDDESDDDFQFDASDLDIDLSLQEEQDELTIPSTEQESDDTLEELELEELPEIELAESESPVLTEELGELGELTEDFEDAEVPELEAEELSVEEFPDELEEEPEEIAEELIPEMESVPQASPAVSNRNAHAGNSLSPDIKDEIKTVLKYMDQLLEALPEEKIQEFARSEHFAVYKRLFEELGLEQ